MQLPRDMTRAAAQLRCLKMMQSYGAFFYILGIAQHSSKEPKSQVVLATEYWGMEIPNKPQSGRKGICSSNNQEYTVSLKHVIFIFLLLLF